MPVAPALSGSGQSERACVSEPRSATRNGGTFSKIRDLQELIRTAVKQNYDLQIAATRVLQAQQQVTITRANQFPTAQPRTRRNRCPSAWHPNIFSAYSYVADALTVICFLELGFLGSLSPRHRSGARHSSRHRMGPPRRSQSPWSKMLRRPIFSFASTILNSKSRSRRSSPARQSLTADANAEQGGATSLEDVRQAQQLVEQAAEAIPQTEQAIQQEENQISVLLGENPGSIRADSR